MDVNLGQVSPVGSGQFHLQEAGQESVHLTGMLKAASELSGEAGEGGEDMSLSLTSFSSFDALHGRIPSSLDLSVLFFPAFPLSSVIFLKLSLTFRTWVSGLQLPFTLTFL